MALTDPRHPARRPGVEAVELGGRAMVALAAENVDHPALRRQAITVRAEIALLDASVKYVAARRKLLAAR
jgi:hypothetical protein